MTIQFLSIFHLDKRMGRIPNSIRILAIQSSSNSSTQIENDLSHQLDTIQPKKQSKDDFRKKHLC